MGVGVSRGGRNEILTHDRNLDTNRLIDPCQYVALSHLRFLCYEPKSI